MPTWPPVSMADAITQLDFGESFSRSEVIPRGQVTPEAIVELKANLGNTIRKAIQRIKAEYPHRQYRVETHHFITDDFKAVIVAFATREV